MDSFRILLEPDFINFSLQIAATIVLYLVLRHFLFKPVNDYQNRRRDYIESNIKESEKVKEDSYKLKEKYDSALDNARLEAGDIVANARKKSEELKQKAIQESVLETQKIFSRNAEAIELERQKVLNSVNDEIADMAIMAAEKVMRQKADEELDKDMIKDFVSDMEEEDD